MQHQTVIIGAGYGGLMTALRLQHQPTRVTLINAEATFVKRIRLHQIAAGHQFQTLNLHDFLTSTPIRFVQAYVREIQPDHKQVVLKDKVIRYDTLVIATGSHVDRDAIPGIREHTYTLDAASAHQLRDRIAPGKRMLVVGGGLTGIEAAAEFAGMLQVNMVTRDTPGVGMSEGAAQHIRDSLMRRDVELHEGVNVRAIYRNYVDTDTGYIDFDLCLWAGGFRANPLAAKAGFSVNERGQMLLCDTLQSIDSNDVYAVGDAGYVSMQNGAPLRMACATAMPMGVHVADNIARQLDGEPPQTFDFGYAVQCIGLGHGNALAQFVRADDSPRSHRFTGLAGSIVKEFISGYTMFSLYLEKWLPGSYRYPKGMRAASDTQKVGKQPV
jgi:NADH:ubiquinone reductase (H+-translocating)